MLLSNSCVNIHKTIIINIYTVYIRLSFSLAYTSIATIHITIKIYYLIYSSCINEAVRYKEGERIHYVDDTVGIRSLPAGACNILPDCLLVPVPPFVPY